MIPEERGTGARLRLLRAAPGYRLVFLAALASGIGTWLAFVALVLDVTERTEDARWVSALLVAEFLPVVVIGLLAGPLVDRLPRRKILIASDLARAVVFLLLPFAPDVLAIVLLALAAGVFTSLFRPALYAGLPNLVSDEDLPQANSLLQTAENLTWAVGAVAGGALVAVSGPDAAYVVNVFSFVVSALLFLRVRESLEETRVAGQGHLRELADGLRLVVSSRPLLTVLIAWSIVMLSNAAVNVAQVFLATRVFDAGELGYGILVATEATGLVIGSFAAGGLIERHGVRGPYGLSIAVMGAGLLAAAAAANLWVALPFVVIAGIGNGAAVVCNVVLVQRGAPDALRGRAFSVLMGIGYAVLGLGMAVAGPITNAYGARTAWVIASGLCAAGALVGFVILEPDSPRREPEPV